MMPPVPERRVRPRQPVRRRAPEPPVETEHGRKRRVSPTSCNTDLSCLKGFCPSFVTSRSAAPAADQAAPWRAREAEQSLVGRTLTPESARAAGGVAFNGARPGRHNGFRVELGARTVADALIIAKARS